MKTLFSLAENFQSRYDLIASTENAFKVIRFAEQLDNKYYLSKSHNLIGINYETILDFPKAEQQYNKALEYALAVKNDTLIGRCYSNMGNIHYMAYDDLAKSNEFYFKAISIASRTNNLQEIKVPTLNVAWNYLDNDDLEKALEYLDKAKSIVVQLGILDTSLYVHYLYGIYHTKNRQYGQATESFTKAIQIGEDTASYLELSDVYLAQSKLYAATNESAKENASLEKYYQTRLQITDVENLKQLSIIESDNNVKEANVNSQEEQISGPIEEAQPTGFWDAYKNIILISLLSLLFAAALWGVIYQYRKKNKKLNELLETRTERLEEAKEEAEKLSQLKSQFISTVSHELRTPLYGVVGLTSLLLEDNTLSDQENQYLKSLKFSGDYLLNLINDILNLSKIESNKIRLEKHPFNVRDLVEDVINSFQFQLDQRNNKMNLHIDKNIPPFLKGDAVPLSQILINLIGNAIKFTSNGNIWVFLKLNDISEESISVNFIIKDDGPGIPKEKHDEIFDNFSQLDRENNEYQGTGLGLSIVKKLIDLLNGEIKLISKEGEGATFNFNLSFDVVKDSNASFEKKNTDHENLTTEGGFGKSYKVLIVEDNRINQIVTKNILLRENFECKVVDNGIAAIDLVKKEKFDLILMDLNMPLMSGIEASTKIRLFNEEVPIVALTAVEIEDVKEEIERAGIDDIINKPFDKNEFYKIILNNINRQKKKQL